MRGIALIAALVAAVPAAASDPSVIVRAGDLKITAFPDAVKPPPTRVTPPPAPVEVQGLAPAPPLRQAGPPQTYAETREKSGEFFHEVVYYAALLLLVVGTVGLAYKWLADQYALDPVPELAMGPPEDGIAEAEARPAARPAPGTGPSDPRARAQRLASAAADALAGGEWRTAEEIAGLIGSDEETAATLLDRLVDGGQAEEARAGDGRTLYRASPA